MQIRRVKDDLYQIAEYVENEYGFEAINVFVLLNEGAPILVDCGSHLHRESITNALNELLGAQIPSHILLTHSELPHAGNMATVAARWPDIQVIVSNVMLPYIEVLPVLPLAQITQALPGTQLTFPTRTITFVDALLKDQPGSQWIFDDRTGTLFTGDGFGYFHSEAEIGQFSDELAGGVTVEQFASYHRLAFRFLRWIKPDRFNADLRRMFDHRPVTTIAPVHGAAIRDAIPTHVARLQEAIRIVHKGYRV